MRSSLALTAAVSGLAAAIVIAGPLSPPAGPVGPTMKTLAQVEPRTPIDTLPVTISTPGSYYLTGNLVGAAPLNGITVTAPDVTIDLAGFTLQGVAGSGHGIVVSSSAAHRLTMKNGVVRGWSLRGIDAQQVEGCRFEGVTVEGCGSDGIYAWKHATIVNCAAMNNGADGVRAERATVVAGCSAAGNTGAGVSGIAGCEISGCAARDNGSGFLAIEGTTVSGCTARENRTHGILVHDRCAILNNTCTNNGVISAGAGIQVNQTNNRVEGNHLIGNDFGIRTDAGANLVIRNSANANTINYDFDPIEPSLNGPIVSPAGGVGTNPHANFDL